MIRILWTRNLGKAMPYPKVDADRLFGGLVELVDQTSLASSVEGLSSLIGRVFIRYSLRCRNTTKSRQ